MARTSIRRRARECALQFLFGLDFTAYEWESVIEEYWSAHPARPSVREYAEHLIKGVSEHLEELDAAIAGALENWTPERIGRVERNVIRLALFEMRHQPDVPERVAISEAIEVAKEYGSDDAPRFVNGVLDRLVSNPGRSGSETSLEDPG